MDVVVTEGDLNYLRSQYPEADIHFPTSQQENLLLQVFRGMSVPAAARASGYKDPTAARTFLKSDTGQMLMSFLREREFSDVRITRETVTGMFMEAYHLAATAGEKVAATRELAKLHGLYPEQQKATEVHIHGNVTNNQLNQKQLQKMTDNELAKLVGPDMANLIRDEAAIDGEIVDDTDLGGR